MTTKAKARHTKTSASRPIYIDVDEEEEEQLIFQVQRNPAYKANNTRREDNKSSAVRDPLPYRDPYSEPVQTRSSPASPDPWATVVPPPPLREENWQDVYNPGKGWIPESQPTPLPVGHDKYETNEFDVFCSAHGLKARDLKGTPKKCFVVLFFAFVVILRLAQLR